MQISAKFLLPFLTIYLNIVRLAEMLDGSSQMIFDICQWLALAVIREVTNLVESDAGKGVDENKRLSGVAMAVELLTPFKQIIVVRTGEFMEGAAYFVAPRYSGVSRRHLWGALATYL
jgi:hypothetical protein